MIPSKNIPLTPRGLAELEARTIECHRLRAALALAKDALERDTGNYSLVLQAIADATQTQ